MASTPADNTINPVKVHNIGDAWSDIRSALDLSEEEARKKNQTGLWTSRAGSAVGAMLGSVDGAMKGGKEWGAKGIEYTGKSLLLTGAMLGIATAVLAVGFPAIGLAAMGWNAVGAVLPYVGYALSAGVLGVASSVSAGILAGAAGGMVNGGLKGGGYTSLREIRQERQDVRDVFESTAKQDFSAQRKAEYLKELKRRAGVVTPEVPAAEEQALENIPENTGTEIAETEGTLEIEKAHPDYALRVKNGGEVPTELQSILSRNPDVTDSYNVEENRLTDLVAMGSDADKRADTAPHWNTLMYPGFTPEQIKDRVNQATTSITAMVGLESLKNNTLTGDAKFEALAALGEELEKHLAACIVGKEGAAVKQPMLVGDMGIAVADLLGDNANELVLQAAAAYTMKKELGSGKQLIQVATQYYSESRLNTAPADIRSKFSDAIIDLANLHNSSITKAGIKSTFNVLYADFSARHPA